jgi:hypothetical protein
MNFLENQLCKKYDKHWIPAYLKYYTRDGFGEEPAIHEDD